MSTLLKHTSSLELSLASGLHLRVDTESDTSGKPGAVYAALYVDGSIGSPRVAFFIAYNGNVRVAKEANGIWFERAMLSLDWHDLLRVAYFLHLDIPQPELPAGQEVPR